jgi:hypothetical protein
LILNTFNTSRFIPAFLAIISLLMFPVLLNAQEIQDDVVTPEERERAQEIRERLVREGFLQEQPEEALLQPLATTATHFADAWHMNRRLSVATSATRGADIRPNGSRYYVVGRGSRNVIEYHLSTPWDISTGSRARELDISSELGSGVQENSAAHGMFIRKDTGATLWIVNRTEIWEYTLSSPWNISTASPVGYTDLSDYVVRAHDIEFKPDGRVLYVDDREMGVVHQFDLSTAWDINTAQLDEVLDISGQQVAVRGTRLDGDGRKMFLNDTDRRDILEYSLSTAWDVSTASFVGSYSVASQITTPTQITFRPDFRTFYINDMSDNRVHQYKISTADPDESTVAASTDELVADGQESSRITVTLRDEDGDRMPGMEVVLSADGGSSQIQPSSQRTTGGGGSAQFDVRNSVPEIITYSATALRNTGNVALSDTRTVRFLPGTPVILAATGVGTEQFTANWEMVNGASNYLLDVSEDSDFDSAVPGYDSLDVGLVTDYEITGLDPGTIYYYRVRAEANGLFSSYSGETEVITFPEVPSAFPAENVIATRFTAQWQPAPGAQEYLLDVAEDEGFTDMVPGYENVNTGDQTRYEITGLYPGTTYYYRVRSQAFTRISESSDAVETSTVQIGLDQSEVTSAQLRVLANGIQENEITVLLRDIDGRPLQGEEIVLDPESGTSQVETMQGTTDENGRALFAVTNMTAEEVSYQAMLADIFEVGTLSVEFLQDEGVLRLGDNYPNPFADRTIIPVTVPQRMHIRIDVTNVLGASIQTVLNEELPQGYYEIPANLHGSASGVYFYRLMTRDQSDVKNMLLVR